MKRTVNPLYSEIGARISRLRRGKGMTQAQLSEDLDITVKHLSECERGLTTLSLEKLILLCDILDTDMEYLVRGNDLTGKMIEIPDCIMEYLRSDDQRQRDLIQEYLKMFIRIQSDN